MKRLYLLLCLFAVGAVSCQKMFSDAALDGDEIIFPQNGVDSGSDDESDVIYPISYPAFSAITYADRDTWESIRERYWAEPGPMYPIYGDTVGFSPRPGPERYDTIINGLDIPVTLTIEGPIEGQGGEDSYTHCSLSPGESIRFAYGYVLSDQTKSFRCPTVTLFSIDFGELGSLSTKHWDATRPATYDAAKIDPYIPLGEHAEWYIHFIMNFSARMVDDITEYVWWDDTILKLFITLPEFTYFIDEDLLKYLLTE